MAMAYLLLIFVGLAAAYLLLRYGLRLTNFAPGTAYGVTTPTPIAISSGDVAAATAACTLPGVAGKTTWIEGFDLSGGGATGASTITGTVTGLPTAVGTLSFDVTILAGATAGAFGTTGNASLLSVRFPSPIPASAPNTGIVVSFPSFGTGNLHAALVAYGYQL